MGNGYAKYSGFGGGGSGGVSSLNGETGAITITGSGGIVITEPTSSTVNVDGSGIVSPSDIVIFKPGVASAGNTYETAAEIATLLTNANGALIVYIDTSIAAAQIPSGVTWNCGNKAQIIGNGFFPQLEVQDGGLILNPYSFQYMLLVCDNVTTTGLNYDSPSWAALPTLEFINAGPILGGSATVPMITVPAGDELFTNWFLGATIQSNSSIPYFALTTGGAQLSVYIANGGIISAWQPGMITGDSTTTLNWTGDASGFPEPVWTGFSGTNNVTYTMSAVGLSYTPTTSSDWNSVPTIDQQALDTLSSSGIVKSQSANEFLASPNGSSGLPSFRAIVAADIPTLNQNTTGTAANITASSNSTITTLTALSLPYSQVTGGPGGTVTSVSVVSANGLAGTVATATTTPAITLSTTVTGVLKGNGTAISAATAGTDYVIPSGSITGTASNITASSNSTLVTLSALSLPGSQVTGNISGNAANITATSNSTLTTLSALSLPTTQLSGNVSLTTQVSGVLPIANGGTDNGSLAVTAGGVLYTDGTKFQNVGAGTSGQVLQSNGSSAPTWATGSTFTPIAPTMQIFTSGSGTYTLPSGPAPLYIRVEMVGGGGGGGGVAVSGSTNGGNGGTTTFGTSLLTATGGGGAQLGSPTVAGAGGGAGTATGNGNGLAIAGGGGDSGSLVGGSAGVAGGTGGSNALGGAGLGGSSGAGIAGATNSGAGGGGGSGVAGAAQSAGGGGAGGYVNNIIYTPSSTYSYEVGSAGSAGTGSSFNGGAGAAGYIQVTEYYQ